MAFTPTLLTKGHFPVGGSSNVNSASVTPGAGKTHIATIITSSGTEDTTHSVSGAGLTWTLVRSRLQAIGGGQVRVSVFEGKGTPTSGAVTFSWTGTAQDSAWWSVVDFANAPMIRSSADTGSASAVSITVTLPAFLDSNSMGVGLAWAQSANITDEAGRTNLYNDDFPFAGQADMEYKTGGDVSVDWGLSAADAVAAVAFELAETQREWVGMIPIGI